MRVTRRSFAVRSAAGISASLFSSHLWAGSDSSSAIPRMIAADFSKESDPAYLSNGLIGIRPGPNPLAQALTLVSGFVFTHPSYRVESLAPAPYPLATNIRVNGVSLIENPEHLSVRRQSLDMTNGELLTEMTFMAGEARIDLEVLQLACRSVPSLLCQEITVRSPVGIEISPGIVATGVPGAMFANRPPEGTEFDLVVGFRNDRCKLGLAAAVGADQRAAAVSSPAINESGVMRTFGFGSKGSVVCVFRTIAALVSDFYHPEPEIEAIRLAKWGQAIGFQELRRQNRQQWEGLWKSRVRVSGDAEAQRVLDAAFFYLHSSVHRSNQNGMPAFGLSQYEHYLGHSFWDTETWSLLPVLLATPDTAKSLLEFRVRGLDRARKTAGLFGYRGAQFPWEASQIDGSEVTPTFAAPGWMEQHITPDIALACWQYQLATNDPEFLKTGTWPVLRAVAEWIESRGIHTQRGFEIEHIMGPDEGIPDVNNNLYVNLACRMVLRAAIRCAGMVDVSPPPAWARIAGAIVLPADPKRNVLLRFDNAPADDNSASGEAGMLTPFDPPLDRALFRNTYERDKKTRGSRVKGVGFGIAALAATAAFLGDKEAAAHWFYASWNDAWLPRFGMIRETPDQTYGCFLTTFGSLLQTAMLGFTGLRIQEGSNWSKYPAVLPSGWTKIEVDRIWVQGEPKRLIAEDGKLARLLNG